MVRPPETASPAKRGSREVPARGQIRVTNRPEEPDARAIRGESPPGTRIAAARGKTVPEALMPMLR